MSHPVCMSVDPRVGAGDQGQWSSCAIFAVTSALAKVLESHKETIDVQQTARALCQTGLKNRDGELVVKAGTDIPYLVEQLDKMFKDGFMLENSSRQFIRLTGVWWEHCDRKSAWHDNMVVAAGGHNGKHGNHALKVEGFQEPCYLNCDNSWGSVQRKVQVPGSTWDTVLAVYRIRISRCQLMMPLDNGRYSDWFNIYPGGFYNSEILQVTSAFSSGGDHFPAGTMLKVIGGDDRGVFVTQGQGIFQGREILITRISLLKKYWRADGSSA